MWLKPKEAKLVLLWHSDILGKGVLYKLVARQERKLLAKADLILATSINYVHPPSPIYPYKNDIRVVQNGIIAQDFNLKSGDQEKVEDIKKRFENKKMEERVARIFYNDFGLTVLKFLCKNVPSLITWAFNRAAN